MEQTTSKPRGLLKRIWLAQIAYNNRVREKEQPDNFEYWMKQYLLGLVSEVDEVLNEINWKVHRRGRPLNPHNLARELADITKYVFSLWEWCSFTHEDMLQYVFDKTQELNVQYEQDFDNEIPADSLVVITDIDGTLGDYRKAFYDWLKAAHEEELPHDTAEHLLMEIDLGLPYSTYVRYKEEFEAIGGYRWLPVYPDVWTTLQTLHQDGVRILAYTARPHQRHSRIWADTWDWLKATELDTYIQELRIGGEERVGRACELQAQGHRVALMEDDPSLALRAAVTGITVFLRDQPYNQNIIHPKIYRCEKFDPEVFHLHWLQEAVYEHQKSSA